jgi:hypothetical protein
MKIKCREPTTTELIGQLSKALSKLNLMLPNGAKNIKDDFDRLVEKYGYNFLDENQTKNR